MSNWILSWKFEYIYPNHTFVDGDPCLQSAISYEGWDHWNFHAPTCSGSEMSKTFFLTVLVYYIVLININTYFTQISHTTKFCQTFTVACSPVLIRVCPCRLRWPHSLHPWIDYWENVRLRRSCMQKVMAGGGGKSNTANWMRNLSYWHIFLKDPVIADPRRVGKLKNGARSRLLKITCGDLTLKRDILAKAKLLRKHNTLHHVYVNPDRTLVQQPNLKSCARTCWREGRMEKMSLSIATRSYLVPI